jgi:hypothetical protein
VGPRRCRMPQDLCPFDQHIFVNARRIPTLSPGPAAQKQSHRWIGMQSAQLFTENMSTLVPPEKTRTRWGFRKGKRTSFFSSADLQRCCHVVGMMAFYALGMGVRSMLSAPKQRRKREHELCFFSRNVAAGEARPCQNITGI